MSKLKIIKSAVANGASKPDIKELQGMLGEQMCIYKGTYCRKHLRVYCHQCCVDFYQLNEEAEVEFGHVVGDPALNKFSDELKTECLKSLVSAQAMVKTQASRNLQPKFTAMENEINEKYKTPPKCTICCFCGKDETKDVKFLNCGACKIVKYCSKICQTNDWKLGHKYDCEDNSEYLESVQDSNNSDSDSNIIEEVEDDSDDGEISEHLAQMLSLSGLSGLPVYNKGFPSFNKKSKTKKSICTYFLQGNCKYSAKQCRFRHDQKELDNIKDEGSKKICHFYANGKCRNGNRCAYSHIDFVSNDDDDDDDSDDDNEEGLYGGYGNFSAADVEELLCQGIKPWEEDAEMALRVLNGEF